LDPPAADDERLIVRIRTRYRPDLGSGRPEEVVAALAEAAGAELVICRTVRERLVLGEDGSAGKPG
jgi:hypothetical protein